jgi:hypothetical protein
VNSQRWQAFWIIEKPIVATGSFRGKQRYWELRSLKASVVLIAAVLIPIVFFPNWGPIDDFHMMEVARDEHYDFTHLGFTGAAVTSAGLRFIPLDYVDWKLIYLLFGLNPLPFYLFSWSLGVVALVVLAAVSKKILGVIHPSLFLLVFMPAFAQSFYGLYAIDRTPFFLLTLFLGIFMLFGENRTKIVSISPLFVLIAVFTKESAFILPFVFAITLLFVTGWERVNNRKPRLSSQRHMLVACVGVVLATFLYLSLYIYFTKLSSTSGAINYIKSVQGSAASLVGGRGAVSLRSLASFIIYDPLLVILLPVLGALRIKYKNNLDSLPAQRLVGWLPLFDAMALAVIAFTAFHVVLGLAEMRYLLPAYVFAFPAIWAYASMLKSRIKSNCWIRIVLIIAGLMVLSASSTGFNQMIYSKYVSYNMARCHHILARELQDNMQSLAPGDAIGIYIAGAQNDYLQRALGSYLKFRGVDTARLAFRTSKDELRSGDYVVMMPNMSRPIRNLYENIANNHRLETLLQTTSPYYVQLPDLRSSIKAMLMRIRPGLLSSQIATREVDYWVLRVY